uniref:Uncharacterized protein n=1 Tax=Globodera rostochiensis TaxID=31243 RepID=A0A914HN64_GLORO
MQAYLFKNLRQGCGTKSAPFGMLTARQAGYEVHAAGSTSGRGPSGASGSSGKPGPKAAKLLALGEDFQDEWWDKDEAAEDLKTPAPTNFGQNVYHQIDRQNTQIGQIELNSTDQLGQIESNSTDQLGQIEPNSTDQLGQIEPNSTDQNPPLTELIILIMPKMGKNLLLKMSENKADLKRDGIKNSQQNQINETVAKELDLSLATIYRWKSEFGQTTANKHSHSQLKELMKRYYEIKDKNPKINDKMLKIGLRTLVNWKRQFKRQQQILSMNIL